MLNLGDVLAVVATLYGIFLTSWAMVLVTGLLFPQVAERAQAAAENDSKRTVVRGLFATLGFGFLAIALMNGGNPLFMVMGWVTLVAILWLAVVGMSGLANHVGERIMKLQPDLAAYPAFMRGTALLIGASLLPILGWLAFAPVLIFASVGAGWKAVFAKKATDLASIEA